jgi:two-component system nitrogen regulation response regulator NtrX
MNLEKIQQELFGEQERHDLTGAFAKRVSLIEAANHGTLYIDEVADLPPIAQAKLLQIIQNQAIEKNNKPLKLDIRIIAATAKDLSVEVKEGRFREDLYYRLNVIPLVIPDLADRKEDIPMLVGHFVHQLVKSSGLKHREFSPEAIATLQSYNWPGNIRELRNVVEWTMIMNPFVTEDDKIVKADMLPQGITSHSSGVISNAENLIDIMTLPLREAREIFEKQYLTAQMSRFNNNISKTSAFVGMERSALHRKLKLLNIHGNKLRLEDEDIGLLN